MFSAGEGLVVVQICMGIFSGNKVTPCYVDYESGRLLVAFENRHRCDRDLENIWWMGLIVSGYHGVVSLVRELPVCISPYKEY